MEYIDGQDLAELMRHGRLEIEFASDVALAVAETLDNAHNLRVSMDGKECQGIVHGDIKPKNIRIDAHGDMRVLDFGIAKALSLSRRLTRNEFGSVPYASPERLDTGEVNAQSDLWSLAVMLYEMVTGMQPYYADSTERLERMVRSRIPPPPAPDPCPEPLRRILVKAMAPDPEMRYLSARDFADDLAAFRKGGQVRAVSEDLDATRRTARPAGQYADAPTQRTAGPEARVAEEETRRTAGRAPAVAPPVAPAPAAQLPRRRVGFVETSCRRSGYWCWRSFSTAGGKFVQHAALPARAGLGTRNLDRAPGRSGPDLVKMDGTFQAGNPSSWLLHGPRKAVKQVFVDAADHIIERYRDSDAQPVTEGDWERARTLLARALAVDPDDTVRGKLRVAEGHLARINGGMHRSPAQLRLAVDDFTEAERLLPQSPDPALGLASVYIYNLSDIDRGYEALQEAEKPGFQLGSREKLMLADGYRRGGDRLFWDSRSVRGLPQEKDQIQRAADDYRRSLELYQSIAPYGNANANIARVQASLESANFRLQEIAQAQGSGSHL